MASWLEQLWNTYAVSPSNQLVSILWNNFTSLEWAVAGCVCFLLLSVGSRLVTLSLEEKSALIIPLRLIGLMMHWSGWLLLLAGTLSTLIILVISYLDQGFNSGNSYINDLIRMFWPSKISYLIYGSATGLILGLIVRWLLIGRYLEPSLNRLLQRATRQKSKKDRLTDIRNIKNHLPQADLQYDPRKYFRGNICS